MLPPVTGFSLVGTPVWSRSNPIRLGLTYGNQGWAMPDVAAFEAWCARKVSLVTIFTTLDNANLPTQIHNVKAAGKIPLVTVEPWLGLDQTKNKSPIAGHMARISSGEFDGQIKTIAPLLAGTWVRFGHEANGSWYPWCQSPGDYVTAWRHFVALLPVTATRVWCVNNGDAKSTVASVSFSPAEAFYPGDRYVDVLALDGYNTADENPAQVFDPMLTRLRAISSLPKAITEAGCHEYPGKVKFVAALGPYAIGNNLTAVSYFNQYDWSIFGGAFGDSSFLYSKVSYKNYQACAVALFRIDPQG